MPQNMSLAEVEGDWNDFHIRLATPEDAEIIRDHLVKNFVRDEPISKLLGFSEEFVKDFQQFWFAALPQKLSLVAFNKSNDKVAAVRMTMDHPIDFDWSNYVITSPEMKVMMYFQARAASLVDIHKHYKLDRYADWFTMSVGREYRGRGLAQEMYRRSIILAKSRGFKLIKSVFTSPYSRKASQNLGFQQICFVKFRDGVNEEGKLYLPEASPEEMLSVGVLEL